ncbi:hypothetical protein ONS95_013483 [Cadophora gregata]|uniref:uncharacterized protein n=1 Tax=Cadophora gregata TaxID=51156 RepID=UPI0026DD51AA|nr:uncharacterized protein ONS95_013483 [Cadophora gregata]KAK0099620.1 hypothetical protein ONS96_008120 [Cadophora gregata f. sp. sojae]KAK0116468.1 hypothetical protein ONS95_013483 [Cadophora gregata]
MRATQHMQIYSVLLLCLFSTFSAAWPWPKWLPELDSLVVRQDNNENSSSAKPTQTQSTNSPKETGSNSNADTTPTGSQTGSQTGSKTGTITGKPSTGSSKKTSSATRKTSYDARLPAGGISLITPNAQTTSYYKIGDHVTFAWNYTSLSATPTAINILASCSANSQTYTLAMNQTITNATGALTWDTGAYQATAVQNPLLTQTYTLIIYDADSSVSAAAAAGYLATFNSYQFGMYVPQAYTPLADFVCATCSGALGDMERRALGMMLGMGVLTLLSFTWFVGGAGVIW